MVSKAPSKPSASSRSMASSSRAKSSSSKKSQGSKLKQALPAAAKRSSIRPASRSGASLSSLSISSRSKSSPSLGASSSSKPSSSKSSSSKSNSSASKRPPSSASKKLSNEKSTKPLSKKPKEANSHLNKLDNLHEVFIDELQDLMSAEIQITQKLPNLISLSSDQKLKDALNQHLEETNGQISRLRKMFSLLKKTPSQHWCLGMEGLLKEGEELIHKAVKGATKDACIIAAAQKVEHYEICGYGTARAHAKQLKLDKIANLLKETFDEEISADKTLSKLAEGTFFVSGINEMAEESPSENNRG